MRLRQWLKRKLAGRIELKLSEVHADEGGLLGSLKNPRLYFKAGEHPPFKESGGVLRLTPYGFKWLFKRYPTVEPLA